MAITMVKCRALVKVAGVSVETPWVQSFNVRKQRGQVSTFDASLKVRVSSVNDLISGDVEIYAGENSASNLIFTGICRSAKISPCHDDPYYVILSISGADALSLLQGKKFTRRCRGTQTSWCSITGVVRKGLKSGKFAYNTEPIIEINDGDIEKKNNVTGYRGQNIVDGLGKLANAPKGGNDIPVIVIAESISIEGGGISGGGPGGL